RQLVDHRALPAEVPGRPERVGGIADLLEQLVRHVVAGPLADELSRFLLVERDDALLAADQLREPSGQAPVGVADVSHVRERLGDLVEALKLPIAAPGPEKPPHDVEARRHAAHGRPWARSMPWMSTPRPEGPRGRVLPGPGMGGAGDGS